MPTRHKINSLLLLILMVLPGSISAFQTIMHRPADEVRGIPSYHGKIALSPRWADRTIVLSETASNDLRSERYGQFYLECIRLELEHGDKHHTNPAKSFLEFVEKSLISPTWGFHYAQDGNPFFGTTRRRDLFNSCLGVELLVGGVMLAGIIDRNDRLVRDMLTLLLLNRSINASLLKEVSMYNRHVSVEYDLSRILIIF